MSHLPGKESRLGPSVLLRSRLGVLFVPCLLVNVRENIPSAAEFREKTFCLHVGQAWGGGSGGLGGGAVRGLSPEQNRCVCGGGRRTPPALGVCSPAVPGSSPEFLSRALRPARTGTGGAPHACLGSSSPSPSPSLALAPLAQPCPGHLRYHQMQSLPGGRLRASHGGCPESRLLRARSPGHAAPCCVPRV